MSFFRYKNSYLWTWRIPAAIRDRVGMGATLQKKLTTRQSKVAESLAAYLTSVVPHLFKLISDRAELSGRELRVLVHNLLHLADTVELRNGIRERGRFLEEDIRSALGMTRGERKIRPTDREFASFGRHLRELTAEFDALSGISGDGAAETTLLSEVILRFLEECKGSCTRATYYNRQFILRTVLEIVGDKPIRDVSRADLRDFKETIVRLPAFWERYYPGVPIPEILAKPPVHRTLATYTVNNYLKAIGTLFEWALVNGYVASNPARKLKIKIRNMPSEERDRLSTADLKLIFEKSVYFCGAKKAIESRKRDATTYHGFWIPLIAIFSGMRASEIIGLERRDIERVRTVWCFRVRPNGRRILKSVSAERTIPIHPALLRMGLVRAIEAQGFEPRSSLWPQLWKLGQHRLSTRFSSFWAQYRREAGVDHYKKTFHSFRHTFINSLLQVEARADIVSDITGHSLKDQVFGRYRKRTPPERLLRSIRRLDFGFSTRHLAG